nr:unnamed protein product [Spirometra erinaceieuropaei]
MEFFQKNFSVLLRLSMVSADDLRQIVQDPAFTKAGAALRLLMRWFFSTYGSPLFSGEQLSDLPSHTLALASESDLKTGVGGDTLHFSQAGQLFLLVNPGSESARVGTDFRIYSVGGFEDEYLLGGYRHDRSFRCNTDFYAYSSDLRKMVLCPPLPGASRIYHGIAASHTCIYLTGGQLEDGTILDSCERFNLVENAWHHIANLDAPRFHHGLACLDGVVYLFGGYRLDSATSESIPSDSVLFYNHVTNRWISTTESLPRELVDMAAVSIPCRHLILLLGGLERDEGELHCTDIVLAFSSSSECTPVTAEGGGCAGVNSGFTSTELSEPYKAKWRRLRRMPRPLRSAAGVYHELSDTVYLVGGRLPNGNPTNEILSFAIFQEQWSFVTTLAIPRYGCSALIHREKLYVLGGKTLPPLLDAQWHAFHFNDGPDHYHHQSQPRATTSTLANGPHVSISVSHAGNAAHVDQPLTIRLLATLDNPLHQMGVEDLPDLLDGNEPQPSTSTAGRQQNSPASPSSPSSSSTPSVLSISSSWNSLFPRGPADSAHFTRLAQPSLRTCYVPEIWRLVSSVEQAMPSPIVPLTTTVNTPFGQPGTAAVDAASATYRPPSLSARRLPPRDFGRDPFSPYRLEPIRVDEAVGCRRCASGLTPTLRRVRCMARYCLAPFFVADSETSLPPAQAAPTTESRSTGPAEGQSSRTSLEPPRIRQLPENVVNKIAAGEVIQRPFNAVKELIENSLDAGSTLIQVILREGGLKLIQVQDNGHGIQPDDLPILCERFTTSKLKSFEDLSHLATFGFRGEALASLSYVSRLTVTTRPAGQSFAFKVEYREGKPLASARPCAGNPGTNITAEDLFFNVPVRREALRSPREEFTRVSEVVSKYSLHFSGKCGFFLRSLDKKSGTAGSVGLSGDFRTAAGWSRQEVVRALFGQRTADDLLPVTSCQSFDAEATQLAIQQLGLRFDALLTNPNKITSAGLPSVQLVLFVNDRLIECSAIKHAIEAAYASILPQHVDSLYSSTRVEPSGTRSSTNFSILNLRASSLFVYLGLQLPPDTLDVNVHPTKAEVHFLHEDAIVAGLREAFIQSLLASSGSRNVLMRSLRLTPDRPSPKIICLDGPSKPSAHAASTPAASRPQDMVRTDARTQRLEALLPGLHGGPLQAPGSSVNPTPNRSPSPDIESDSEAPPSPRISNSNTAVVENSLSTSEAGEFLSGSDSLKQQPPVSAGASVRSSRPLVRRPVLLASVIAMRTNIETAASSEAQGLLRECVFVGCLPLFMLRLVQDVNWNEEASCFEGICRLTADFYARRTEDSRKSDVKKDSEEVDALFASDDELTALEDEKENTALPPTSECRRLKLPWQWTVEHVLIPAFRTVLLPAHSLCFCEGSATSPALLKLTSLNDLYKVFERC